LRWKWTIAGVAALASAIVIPLIWMFVVPMYRSRALIHVGPGNKRLVYRDEDNTPSPFYRTFLNTQVQIIQSPAVLERVLDDPDVRQTPWYREQAHTLGGSPLTPLERLMRELTVRPGGDDELIEVAMDTRQSLDCKVIANTVAREFEKLSRERSQIQDAELLNVLNDIRKTYQKEIESINIARHNVAQRLGTLATEELRSTLKTQLSAMEIEAARLEREKRMTEWRLDMFAGTQASPENGAAGPPKPDRRYAADAEWRKLNIDLENARTELQNGQQQFGEAHPRIRQLLNSVDRAERVLHEREAQLEEQWEVALPGITGSEPSASNQNALERHKREQETELMLRYNEIKAQREQVETASEVALRLGEFDEQLREVREAYEDVRARLKVRETESKAPVQIQVAGLGVVPSRPDRDRRILLTLLTVLGSLALGVVAGYIRSMLDPRVREADDVQYAVRAPFLGQLPRLPQCADLMADASPPLLEAMRMVRTVLLERISGAERSVVLVTSATAQTGKSSIALLLARSLALVGKRVLLVEADLHRPSLSRRLQIEPKRGLAALLTGDASDTDVIVQTRVPRLDVLLAGERTPVFDPELLANGVFSACLRRWKERFDVVVLDSPPVLPVADARILARQSDGTIMVLRSAHDRKPDVTRAYADLGAAGGKLLGTILVNERFGSQYGYADEYYAYQSTAALAHS
ncbi:MAG TPA: polysaccharide biosynthesis tyrosine autokinase, partial [Phycisphaerae bacterium]